MDSYKKVLMDIPVDKIDRNPENPRLYFRQQELDELTDSIRRHGVQVPIAVYRDENRYVLIDGERRWRCSLKLNKKSIPALVQEKPDALNNLVLMFNIHALREQWDLLTIALKLPRVIDLYKRKNGYEPNERQLSEETGLSRSSIRRCKLLMSLPEHHLDNIKSELKKPKSQQRLSEDFYIEMEKALVTVSRAMPDIISDEQSKENARQALLYKYSNRTIKNLVDLRKIGKIARAGNVKADIEVAKSEIRKLFNVTEYTIDQAYQNSVSEAYLERDIKTTVESLIDELSAIEQENIDNDILELLQSLEEVVHRILGGQK